MNLIARIAAIPTLMLGVFTGPLLGAQLASDNASDPAYADGWIDGSNGGAGWGGGWSFRNSTGPVTYVIGKAPVAAIDSPPTTDGSAWGVLAGEKSYAYPTRAFSDALSPGQSFSIDMDVQPGLFAEAGWHLLDSSGRDQFQFLADTFEPGVDYAYIAGSVRHEVGVELHDSIHLTFTLLDSNGDFGMAVTFLGGDSTTSMFYGTIPRFTDLSILELETVAGFGQPMYFNHIAVTMPEPTALILLPFAGIAALRRRR